MHINVTNNNTISIVKSSGIAANSVPKEYITVVITLNPQNIKANMAISQLDKFFIGFSSLYEKEGTNKSPLF